MAIDIKEKFFSKVEKTDDCWIWLGAKTSQGYGKFLFSKGQLAHRYSYFLHYGFLPEYKAGKQKLVVMHKCDNPQCTNPDHLVLGTHKENTRDAWRKGLVQAHGRGGKRKINAKTAVSIYQSDGKYQDIADQHNCAWHTVADIKTGRRWARVIKELAA